MNPTQQIAQRITSVFEFDPDKPLVNNERDGRGLTCNCSPELAFGFTTANEEVVMCVELYTKAVPFNHLAPFLPLLRRLRDQGRDSVWMLKRGGFETHWANAAVNPQFQAAYSEVVDRLFGQAAQKHCDELNWNLAIGYAALFDALVQHGNEGDPDGVPMMLVRSFKHWPNAASEIEQIAAFLDERKKTLEKSHDPETREEWQKSVTRVEALIHLLHTNRDLELPVRVVCRDWDVVLR